MNLTSVRYFVRVAEVGSISRAATDLGIVQPALSRHIQRLEHEIGDALLVRLPRGVQLTAAGRQFLDHARRIVKEVLLAQENLARTRGIPGGHVVFGLPPSIASIVAPDFFRQMREGDTVFTMEIVTSLSEILIDHLVNGTIEVAVLCNPPRSPALNLIPLISEPFVVVASPGAGTGRRHGPYSLAELTSIPIVTTPAFKEMIDQQIGARGKQLLVEFQTASMDVIRRILLGGSGISCLPISTLREEIEAGRLEAFPIRDVTVYRNLVIAHRPGDLSPAAQTFTSLLQRRILELAADGTFSTIPPPPQCQADEAGRKAAAR